MKQVEVEITGQAITAEYGTLSTGDILRCDKAFAEHLIHACGCAKYVETKVEEKPKAKSKPDDKQS